MILLILTTLTLGYQLDEKQNGGESAIDKKNILKQLDEDKRMTYEIIESMDEKDEFDDEYFETEEHDLEKKGPWILRWQRRTSSCPSGPNRG